MWVVTITAWFRNPSDVPKWLAITVSSSVVQPTQPDSDEEGKPPSAPMFPRKMRTIHYNVIGHVKEVIDRDISSIIEGNPCTAC
jgi:hypothetical protein